jgi:GT2 family glycosyltransferase
MPKISIIVITYNRRKELIELLVNLQDQDYENREIIVVDNNSTDDTAKHLKNIPGIQYYLLDENLGVPGGRNYGIRKAKGDLLFFIDNDAELIDGGLQLIESEFRKNKHLGILACRIDNFFSRELDLSSWVYTIHKLKDKDISFDTFYFVGCGFVIKREVIDTCGLFWDDLFFMHEEKDFAFRVINAGYTIRYEPGIRVYHKVSLENRYNVSSRFYEYGARNMIWIFIRYYPIYLLLLKIPAFIILQLNSAMKTSNVNIFIKSLRDSFSNIDVAIKKRQVLDRTTLKKIKKLQYVKKDSLLNRVIRVVCRKKIRIVSE